MVLSALLGLSLVVRHFWCRYLCPYGALTALIGMASPTRIKRNLPSCIDCCKCTRACPAALPVHRLATVHSDECALCLECTQACPVPDTLAAEIAFPKIRVRPLSIALAIAALFLAVIIYGKWSGHWRGTAMAQPTIAQSPGAGHCPAEASWNPQ